jgi:hypothetical protein
MKSISVFLVVFLSSHCFGQTVHNNAVTIHGVSIAESMKRLSTILEKHYHYHVLDTSTHGANATLTMDNGYNTAILCFDTTGNGTNTILSDNYKEDKGEKDYLQEFATRVESYDDKMQPFQAFNESQESEIEVLRNIQSSVTVIEVITVSEAILAVLGTILVLAAR